MVTRKQLTNEFDSLFKQWKEKQTPLAQAVDRLESSTAKIEQQSNDSIYERMNPFNRCGKFDLHFMEETFGDTNGVRSMRMDMSEDTRQMTQKEIDDEIRKAAAEDYGITGPEDSIGEPI